MKTNLLKRLLASTLTTAFMLSSSSFTVQASSVGETVKGDSVDITVETEVDENREQNFNKDWKFYLGDNSSASNQNFDDSSWDDVDIPHDFSIIQGYTTSGEAESGFLPGGTGWYRKSFTMPESAEDKSVILNFDGVYSEAYVYINGTSVGEHHYGYTSFAFDISDYLICDGVSENVVAVKAVNKIPSSRWYSGSGIYRDVTLIVTDAVHVDHNGTYVTTPNIADNDGTVKIAVDIVNDTNSSVSVTVTNTVYKKDTSIALASANEMVSVTAGGKVTSTTYPTVESPELWSIDDPNLYIVVTELSVNDEVVDTYETEFGFRWFNFDSTGFHLNDQNVKLNGVCMHHDQGGLGSAAYYDAMYRQLSIMKDMGVNAIRTAHNPADEDYIKICNELGLLVIEEAFDGLNEAKNGNTYDFARYFEASVDTKLYGAESGMTCSEYAARSMVRRDRNNPAIIAWSFGNEIQEGTYWNTVDDFAGFCADFIDWVNEEDGSRPVTSGDNNRGGDSRLVAVLNTIKNSGGVLGFNYANTASSLYSLAQNYGGGVIIASETSSATNSRGQYLNQNNNSNSDGAYHLTSYDTSAVSWGITAHDSIYNTYQYDCVAGEFVWTGFDYLGEPTPWNGTGSGSVSGSGAYPNSSYFGIVETTGFEKDTYYLYRSQWNKNETTLHLVTAWDDANMYTTSGKTPVWVYSNAPVVKLYRDGSLIGTATRNDVTSAAGHTYYTYSSVSNNSSVCSVTNGSGADALYAVFNVAYTAGTLSAKAFDTNGNEIALTGNSGKNSVTTPGTVSKLSISQNKTEMTADGSSLVYITVDITDANGNLDTTASNTINFNLIGNGEIVAVDNGNQATTAKYQQSSVLTSPTSAKIAAYAGKALAIVRSTDEAGEIQINVTASALTGGSVVVTTSADQSEIQIDGLARYSMVKDYTVKTGTYPELETNVCGFLADGTEVNGSIEWDTISDTIYNNAGDYTIQGILRFDGEEDINVSARLHVLDNVIAMRNVSAVTIPGVVPALGSTVAGVLSDGTLSGEFNVTWDNMSESDFSTVGDIVVVNGTVVMMNETIPVTASVRVVESVVTDTINVAPQVLTLEQDISANYQSDVLNSIINGTLKPGDNTSERWTNWNNRTRSDEATLTFTWATAQRLDSLNLYYYYDNCCAYPENIEFSYSLNGSDYTLVGYTASQTETYTLGAEYTYTLDQVINPVSLRITFTQQNGTSGSNCVGLTEVEIMSPAEELVVNSTAALSSILIDGEMLDGFASDVYTYTVSGDSVTAAESEVNAGITILPPSNNVVRILTISEDGSTTALYTVTLEETVHCDHEETELVNAAEPTCTVNGYTGDSICKICGEIVEQGSVILAQGHPNSILKNAVNATCTETGYTGDLVCSDCGDVIEYGDSIAATGHQNTEINNIVSPTCTEDGYSGDIVCNDCGTTIVGDVIPATGHQNTEKRNELSSTCIEEGYTGDVYCTDCGEIVEVGSVIPVVDHSYDDGVVTKEPTEAENGILTYTCSVCGNTKQEEIEYVVELKVPVVSISAIRAASSKIKLTATFEDYENADEYFEEYKHGILYITSSRLGTRTLTVNTSGKTNISFTDFSDNGQFSYTMKPVTRYTTYVVRSYVQYINADGELEYVYSDPIRIKYSSLS